LAITVPKVYEFQSCFAGKPSGRLPNLNLKPHKVSKTFGVLIKKDGWVSPIRQVLYDKGKSEFATLISFGERLERDQVLCPGWGITVFPSLRTSGGFSIAPPFSYAFIIQQNQAAYIKINHQF
jgi:hypothetical protein